MKVYVVVTSNCEVWDDYLEAVESIWATEESAVSHIESDLGMEKVFERDPSKPWTYDRWMREDRVYAEREPGETDEEWAEWLDADGNPRVVDVVMEDARVMKFELNGL